MRAQVSLDMGLFSGTLHPTIPTEPILARVHPVVLVFASIGSVWIYGMVNEALFRKCTRRQGGKWRPPRISPLKVGCNVYLILGKKHVLVSL